jgi:PA14 domain
LIEWLRLRAVMLLIIAVLAWALIRAVRPMVPAGDGLGAKYYSNPSWDGRPSQSGTDRDQSTSVIWRRWKALPPERFSVRWTGYLTVPRSGSYVFATTSDDGSSLYIDGRIVVDNSGQHASMTQTGGVRLTEGSHRIRLDYSQQGGAWAFEWSWARDDGIARAVPTWALSERRPRARFVTVAWALDGGLWGLTILILVVAAWNIWVRGQEWAPVIARWTAARWQDAKVRSTVEVLAFELFVFVLVLMTPWPGAGGDPTFYRSLEITVRNFGRSSGKLFAGGFRDFQANVNTPRAGEDLVLPNAVQEMLAIVRHYELQRYEISEGLAANPWVTQQIVASAWPSKRQNDAAWRFVLNVEPALSDCIVTERRTEVTLVHCP